jgi:hypothetical protein
MKIQYIGRRNSFTDNLYGSKMVFPKGEFIEVPEAIAKKLLRHPEFSQFTEKPSEPVPGTPANIQEMSKAEFGEYAQSLGIDLDMRRSLEKLRQDFAAAMAASNKGADETPETPAV